MTHKFQSDAMLIRRRGNDQRSDQDIVDAYVFERRLSDKLRTASAEVVCPSRVIRLHC